MHHDQTGLGIWLVIFALVTGMGCSEKSSNRIDQTEPTAWAGPAPGATQDVRVELDRQFYSSGEQVSARVYVGDRAVDARQLYVVLVPSTHDDVEVLQLTERGSGIVQNRSQVRVEQGDGPSKVNDGKLDLAPGESFQALLALSRDVEGMDDYRDKLLSDVGFMEDSSSQELHVESAIALPTSAEAEALKPSGTLFKRKSLPVQIATQEVVVSVHDEQELNQFLARVDGSVLDRVELAEDEAKDGRSLVARVRVQPSELDAQRLAALEKYVQEEEAIGSSTTVHAIAGLVLQLRLDGWSVAVNPRLEPHSKPALDPNEQRTYTMQNGPTEGCIPDSAALPCPLNVPASWAFLELWDIGGTVNVGVLDEGFAVNSDFRMLGSAPLVECDLSADGPPICGPGAAQGPPTVGASGVGDLVWHGTAVTQVLGGIVNNGALAAGVAGQAAVPMLYRYGLLEYAFEMGLGVRKATDDGASVINISAGYPCHVLNHLGPDIDICTPEGRLGLCAIANAAAVTAALHACLLAPLIPIVGEILCGVANGAAAAAVGACVSANFSIGDVESHMRRGISYAYSHGVPVVVSAGNTALPEKYPAVARDLFKFEDWRVERWHVIPPMIPETIVVGAVDDKLNNVELYGDRVDIWAPTYSAWFGPSSADAPISELANNPSLSGTSAAAPYVTGAIALAQLLDPKLNPHSQYYELPVDTQQALSDRYSIVRKIKALLKADENSWSNDELAALNYPPPNVPQRLINVLELLKAAAKGRVPDYAAENYDTSLGFADAEDDTEATAQPIGFEETRTGTILTMPTTSGFTSAPDEDWYQVQMPSGSRPLMSMINVTIPGAFGDLGAYGPNVVHVREGVLLVQRSGTRATFRVAASTVGADNVYKVQVAQPVAARPTLLIRQPTALSSTEVCAHRPVHLAAETSFYGIAGLEVLPESIKWLEGSVTLASGSSANVTFEPGSHEVSVEAYAEAQTRMSVTINATLCTGEPPTADIVSPPVNVTSANDELYVTSYGTDAEGFYIELVLQGRATDPEDGILSGASLHWLAVPSDSALPVVSLGTGNVLRARLHQSCESTNTIRLVVTDADGNSVWVERRVDLPLLC